MGHMNAADSITLCHFENARLMTAEGTMHGKYQPSPNMALSETCILNIYLSHAATRKMRQHRQHRVQQ